MGLFTECVISKIDKYESNINKDENNVPKFMVTSHKFLFSEPAVIYWEILDLHEEQQNKEPAQDKDIVQSVQSIQQTLYSNTSSHNKESQINDLIEKFAEKTLLIVHSGEKKHLDINPPGKTNEVNPLDDEKKKVFEYRTIYNVHPETKVRNGASLLYHVILPEYCYTDNGLILCNKKTNFIIVTREKKQSITFFFDPPYSEILELLVIFFYESQESEKFNRLKNSQDPPYKLERKRIPAIEEIKSNITSANTNIGEIISQYLYNFLHK